MSKRAAKLVGGRGLETVWDSGVKDSGVIETSRVVRTRLLW